MQKLYTIVDKVAKLAGNPMVFNTDAEANRYFVEVICREGSLPAARPSDFEWRCVATFDRETGDIETGDVING